MELAVDHTTMHPIVTAPWSGSQQCVMLTNEVTAMPKRLEDSSEHVMGASSSVCERPHHCQASNPEAEQRLSPVAQRELRAIPAKQLLRSDAEATLACRVSTRHCVCWLIRLLVHHQS